jgi:hypothetical protein
MAEEGLDLAILYPSRGLNVLSNPNLAAPFAAALARAYNDWLYEFCQADPNKLVGAGMISPFDIDAAVAEAERCVKQLGFRAIFLRANIVNGHNWHDEYYEPLWSALEDLNVALGFHEANNSLARQSGDNFGYDFMLRHTYSHPVEQMLAVGSRTTSVGPAPRKPSCMVTSPPWARMRSRDSASPKPSLAPSARAACFRSRPRSRAWSACCPRSPTRTARRGSCRRRARGAGGSRSCRAA